MYFSGWTLLFVVSLCVNGLLAWILRNSLEDINSMRNVTYDLYEECSDFAQHLEVLYEMNSYNGDEVLLNLVKHSKELMNSFGEYAEIVEYFEPSSETETEEEEQSDENIAAA